MFYLLLLCVVSPHSAGVSQSMEYNDFKGIILSFSFRVGLLLLFKAMLSDFHCWYVGNELLIDYNTDLLINIWWVTAINFSVHIWIADTVSSTFYLTWDFLEVFLYSIWSNQHNIGKISSFLSHLQMRIKFQKYFLVFGLSQ